MSHNGPLLILIFFLAFFYWLLAEKNLCYRFFNIRKICSTNATKKYQAQFSTMLAVICLFRLGTGFWPSTFDLSCFTLLLLETKVVSTLATCCHTDRKPSADSLQLWSYPFWGSRHPSKVSYRAVSFVAFVPHVLNDVIDAFECEKKTYVFLHCNDKNYAEQRTQFSVFKPNYFRNFLLKRLFVIKKVHIVNFDIKICCVPSFFKNRICCPKSNFPKKLIFFSSEMHPVWRKKLLFLFSQIKVIITQHERKGIIHMVKTKLNQQEKIIIPVVVLRRHYPVIVNTWLPSLLPCNYFLYVLFLKMKFHKAHKEFSSLTCLDSLIFSVVSQSSTGPHNLIRSSHSNYLKFRPPQLSQKIKKAYLTTILTHEYSLNTQSQNSSYVSIMPLFSFAFFNAIILFHSQMKPHFGHFLSLRNFPCLLVALKNHNLAPHSFFSLPLEKYCLALSLIENYYCVPSSAVNSIKLGWILEPKKCLVNIQAPLCTRQP
ncbi:putative signal peptide protein [Puccinia sorghi]|uniref:Putative signal peptide protein n=1 Tax=Puccinia sorghi TaxID=27349 RepID=A0A0L6USI2_9BASI|nr:putative signal peptide protein [Puccinia sorghi]